MGGNAQEDSGTEETIEAAGEIDDLDDYWEYLPIRGATRSERQLALHCVRCSADLLLNGMRSDLEAEGRCPVCETLVRFQVKDREIMAKLDTSALYVVEVVAANGQTGIKGKGSPIFDKEDCRHGWLDNYHGKAGLNLQITGVSGKNDSNQIIEERELGHSFGRSYS